MVRVSRLSGIGLNNHTGAEVLNGLVQSTRDQIICTDAQWNLLHAGFHLPRAFSGYRGTPETPERTIGANNSPLRPAVWEALLW